MVDKIIPRLSYDLLEVLKEMVEAPKLPTTGSGWGHFNEGEVRRGAFLAGRRSLVEDLLAWQAEDEENAQSRHGTSTGTPGGTFGADLLDSGGEPHINVAPPHMAPSNPTDDPDDEGGPS